MVASYESDEDEEVKDLIDNYLLLNNDLTPMALALDPPLLLQVLGIQPRTETLRPVGIGSSAFFFSSWSDRRFESSHLDLVQQAKIRSAVHYLMSLVG